MSVGMWQMICASVVLATLLTITLGRQRKFELPQLGVLLAGFLGAFPLPTAIVLYLYGFFPDPPHVQTKLQGLHLYVAAAGVLMFLVGSATIWRLVGVAYQTETPKARKRKATSIESPPGSLGAEPEEASGDATSPAERRRSAGRS